MFLQSFEPTPGVMMIAGPRDSAGYSHPFSVSPSIVLKLMSLRLLAIFDIVRGNGVIDRLGKDCHNP